jgi:hypothetical protein
MGDACGTHGGEARRIQGLVRIPEGKKGLRIPSIFKDESTGLCVCFWKLAVAVATYVSICIVYCILPSFAF